MTLAWLEYLSAYDPALLEVRAQLIRPADGAILRTF